MLARSTGGGSGGPPFSLEGRETIWQQPRSCLAMQAKAKPLAAAIRDCLDYGKNPEKTEGKYISAYECDPATVAEEFSCQSQLQGRNGTGAEKETDVLCYQIRMAF